MKASLKLTFCSVITAISLTFMLLTGLFPIGTYALPAFAGVAIVAVNFEINFRASLFTYLAVLILSILFVPDKEAVLMFILLFGYYPNAKLKIEKMKNKFAKLFTKLLIFNASVVTAYAVALKFLSISGDEFVIFGVSVPIIFLLAGNMIFLLYDYALIGLISYYNFKVHPYVKKLFRG